VDVCRDLLDKPLVDRNGREMGRVDGVLIEQPAGEPPRLAEIVAGPSALAERLHPTLGRLMARLESMWRLSGKRPVRIAMSDVLHIDRHVKIARTIAETGADEVEKRVRSLVTKIPGA